MKAILCGWCSDFRALRPKGPVSCSCGNVTGWWTDSKKGIAKVYAREREFARIIGIDNYFLIKAFPDDKRYPSDEEWRQTSQVITELAEGYLFHKDKRNCPVVIIGIGQSNDVTWANEPYKEVEDVKPQENL
jgi:hypothetical protein